MDKKSYKKLQKLRAEMEDAPSGRGRAMIIRNITINMEFLSKFITTDNTGELFVKGRTAEVKEFLERDDIRGRK